MRQPLNRIVHTSVFVVAVGIAGTSCGGDDGAQETSPCDALREHLIDLRLATASPQVNKEAHRAAMRQALSQGGSGECLSLTERQRTCVLHSVDLQGAMSCNTTTMEVTR